MRRSDGTIAVTTVSIPDRCNSDFLGSLMVLRYVGFQFQISAIQIRTEKGEVSGNNKFQFQIGAIQIIIFIVLAVAILMFQFQIGAIQIIDELLEHISSFVSIPDRCNSDLQDNMEFH